MPIDDAGETTVASVKAPVAGAVRASRRQILTGGAGSLALLVGGASLARAAEVVPGRWSAPDRIPSALAVIPPGLVGDGVADDAPVIQAALDYVAQQGGGMVSLPAGTFAVGRSLVLRDHVTLGGLGMWVTTLLAIPPIGDALLMNADPEAGNRGIVIRDLSIDGNRDRVPQEATREGIFLKACQDFAITAVEVHHAAGTGIYIDGAGLLGYRGPSYLHQLHVHDNGGTSGLQVSHAARRMMISDVVAEHNLADGVILDATQITAVGIVARYNGHEGIWIRNVASGSYTGLVAELNQRHGIECEGLTNVSGANWRAQSNGQSAADAWDDIHFGPNPDPNGYGPTDNCAVSGVVTGPAPILARSVGLGVVALTRHGLHIEDDAVGLDVGLRIDGWLSRATRSATLRRPALAPQILVNGS